MIRTERLADARERESQERALRKVTDELRAMSVKLSDAEGSLEATQQERQTEVTCLVHKYLSKCNLKFIVCSLFHSLPMQISQLQVASKDLELRLERTQEEQRVEVRKLTERLRAAETNLSQKEGRCVELEEERLRLDLSCKQSDATVKQLREQLEKKISEVSTSESHNTIQHIEYSFSSNVMRSVFCIAGCGSSAAAAEAERTGVDDSRTWRNDGRPRRPAAAAAGLLLRHRYRFIIHIIVLIVLGRLTNQSLYCNDVEACDVYEPCTPFAAELERKLHLAESKCTELERSMDQWKARVEATEQQLKAMTADRGAPFDVQLLSQNISILFIIYLFKYYFK